MQLSWKPGFLSDFYAFTSFLPVCIASEASNLGGVFSADEDIHRKDDPGIFRHIWTRTTNSIQIQNACSMVHIISTHFWWYFLMLDSQVFPNQRPWFQAELGKSTLSRIGRAQEPLREILSLVLERCLQLYQTMCKGATKTRPRGMWMYVFAQLEWKTNSVGWPMNCTALCIPSLIWNSVAPCQKPYVTRRFFPSSNDSPGVFLGHQMWSRPENLKLFQLVEMEDICMRSRLWAGWPDGFECVLPWAL